jgi:hypothetical protein
MADQVDNATLGIKCPSLLLLFRLDLTTFMIHGPSTTATSLSLLNGAEVATATATTPLATTSRDS